MIHAKEKSKVHVKGAFETKIKDRNILTVLHGLKIVENGKIRINDAHDRIWKLAALQHAVGAILTADFIGSEYNYVCQLAAVPMPVQSTDPSGQP